jgi:hypothetical protein
MLGYVFPIGEARGEKERESTWEQMVRPPLPKLFDSIYRKGGDNYLYFILLVG